MKNNNELEKEQLKEVIESLQEKVLQYETVISNLNAVVSELGKEVGRRHVEMTCLNLELAAIKKEQMK